MPVVWNRIVIVFILFLTGLQSFVAHSQSGEKELEELRSWLKDLGISYSTAELQTIPWLDLSGTAVTDADLHKLEALTSLAKLDLRNTAITDEGLRVISQLTTLEVIWLDETLITDAGLSALGRLTNLQELYLPEQISVNAVESLQSAIPDATIHHDIPIGSDPEFLIWIILGGILIAIFFFIYFKATFIKEKAERVLFAIGIFFFLAFLLLLINAIHFVSVSIYANGRVTELVMKTSSSSDHGTSITYHPKVAFTAQDDQQYTFVSDMGSSPPSYEVGEPVQVMYDPERPNEAEIHSEGGVFTVFSYPLVMLIFAVVLTSSSGALKPVYTGIARITNPQRVQTHAWLTSVGVNKTFAELSNKYYCDIKLEGKTFNNADLFHLKAIRNLTFLNLSSSSVTDSGLEHISKITKLNNLNLSKTAITDAGLAHLANLKRLEYLDLSSTQINGSGLKHLKRLQKLKDLELTRTNVDDNYINDLAEMKTLEDIHLSDTYVTEEGARKLVAILSDDVVWWRPSKRTKDR